MPAGPAPVLSITMPTRNRPALFERALGSIIKATASLVEHIEITVSDGSDDDATGKVAERLLASWPGRHRYVWNRPGLALVDNLNRAIELATGDWIQQLHDDDYLLPDKSHVETACSGRPDDAPCGTDLAAQRPCRLNSEEADVRTEIAQEARIFVAGPAGLVGSAIVRRLHGAGFSNLLTATRQQLDLRDQSEVNHWFKANAPDYVFLVAGTVGGILANSTRPAEFIYDNLMIHGTVVDASRRYGVRKLLYLGSSCITPDRRRSRSPRSNY
jgi:glycosyltransferase involved in cell wall biosynthesis